MFIFLIIYYQFLKHKYIYNLNVNPIRDKKFKTA